MREEIPEPSRIAKAAGMVMIAFLISNLAGLARQIIVAKYFGTGAEMEAFNAANRVAETLFNLVAGGALGSAFIPTFTGLLARECEEKAWKLASSMWNLILIVLIILSIIAAIFSPQLVRWVLAPGFVNDPAKEQLTINLLRLMLPSSILFGLSGLVMGILNSKQVFFIPALTPSMYQFGMLFGVIVLSPYLGIQGLGWGVLLGSALHLILQIPSLIKLKPSYQLTLGLDIQEVREVGRLMAPRLLGVAVVQLNFWVNTRIASQQPEGSLTGIIIAFALMLMPQAAIAQSIAIASLPTLSSQFTLGMVDQMRSTLASSLRGILLLSVPASIGLILLRSPIVKFLYQRGEFDERSTQLVTWALLWYAIGLVGHSLVEILARAFYAMHDTRTPVTIGAIAMGLNILLSYLFANLFQKIGWLPHGGLALANSVATSLEMAALLLLIHRRMNGIQGKRVMRALLEAGFASIIMGIGLMLWISWSTDSTNSMQVFIGILIGGLLYGGMAFIIHIPEFLHAGRIISGKLKAVRGS